MDTITVPKNIKENLKNASQDMGVSEDVFLANAVAYYLDNLKKTMDLKKELELWDRMSDKDTAKFEENI